MKIKNFIRRSLLPLYQKSQRETHLLKYIFFELTNNCNISCLHCGSDCVKRSDIPDLPADSVISTLKEIKTKYNSHNICVILSGGEPLCYPGIFKLGEEITKLEFPWGMVTNGYGWTLEKIKLAEKAGMQSVTVSLDGLEDDHNWLRGKKDSFSKAINTIKMFVDNPFYQALDVITCVNKRNIYKLDKQFQLLKEIGVKRWRFFLISPIGRATEHPELFINGEEFKYLLDKIEEFKLKDDIKVNLSESGYIGCELNDRVRNHDYFCMAGINVAGIMLNGDILACPNIDRRFKQGNIYSDSFIDCWENKYKIFRNRKWMKTHECEKCKEWKYCNGNSFHLWDIDKNKTKFCHHKLINE